MVDEKRSSKWWVGCALAAVLLLALAVSGWLYIGRVFASSMSAPKSYTRAEALAHMTQQHGIAVPDDARDVYCFRYGRDPHWYMAFSAKLSTCWQEAEKYAGVKKAAFRKWNPANCPRILNVPKKKDHQLEERLWPLKEITNGFHFNNRENGTAPILKFALVDEEAGRVYFIFGTQ
jgi:hypothetical protein